MYTVSFQFSFVFREITLYPNSVHYCVPKVQQGDHGTGKTGNLAVNFSRQGKHREFSKFIFLHRENGANTGKILNFLKILLLKWQQGDGAFLS